MHASVRKNVSLPALLLLFCVQGLVYSQSPPVSYRVTLDKRPTSHFLHIEIKVQAGDAGQIDLAMPAWSPGAYGIRNGWRNVQEFSAADEQGQSLPFEKIDKQTWRIERRSAHSIITRYKLYTRDYNDGLCYIRGPSVFMYVVGRPPYPLQGPVTVKLQAPANWRIQTGLEPAGEANSFKAESYDSFIDASILLGPDWEQTHFQLRGVPHYLVFIGKGNYDKEKITRDTEAIVRNLTEMMGGVPYKKYVFFLRARGRRGSGGLEHLNSTDISFSAYQTHKPLSAYKRFLFVVAHEYFHLWNVKRIRPAILGPFDYSTEQNTRNLYVSEGMTSYWATIGLKRSGVWSLEDTYEELARQIKTLQSAPGRKIMSVEQSSWDTWGRGDNAANNRIDYYNKGELLGSLLDLEIRFRTRNRRSLEDVFRYLLENYGLPKPGFEEVHGFRDAVEHITREAAPDQADFGDFFANYVSGTREIPWNAYLSHAGLALEEKKGEAKPYLGMTTGNRLPSAGFFRAPPRILPSNQIAVTRILPGSPAEEGGVDVGDILVAMDGDAVDPKTFDERLAEKQIGANLELDVLRRGRLRKLHLGIGKEEPVTYSIKEKKDATQLQKRIFTSWLGENATARHP